MDFIRNLLNNKKFALLSSIAFVIIAGIFVFALYFNDSSSGLLYQKLSASDQYAIEMRLEKLGIPFSTKEGGIFVPQNKVRSLRMMFAQENIPTEVVHTGYNIFDKVDFLGTSSFLNNVNLTRALEGELARTITMLSGIEAARVHIVMPKSDYFVKNDTKASASVALKLRPGVKLTKDEINGIAHLITTSVPSLLIENITIVDSSGKMLKYIEEQQDTSTEALKYKRQIEESIRNDIENIVGEFVGAKKIVVNVMADVNFDKEVIVNERYDPDEQVMRSQKTLDENDSNGPAKNVSVATNIPNSRQRVATNNLMVKNKSSTITNYEISKTVVNKVAALGQIKKISVAVLVDGKYIADKDDNLQYTPRSNEELSKIRTLVSGTIGFDQERGDKIEVINLQFDKNIEDDNEAADLFNKNIESFFGNSAMNIVIFIVVVLIIAGLVILTRDKGFINTFKSMFGLQAPLSTNANASHGYEANRDQEFGDKGNKVNNKERGEANEAPQSAYSEIRKQKTSEDFITKSEMNQKLNSVFEELEIEDIISAMRRTMYAP